MRAYLPVLPDLGIAQGQRAALRGTGTKVPID
jgi:hypothetical protein